MGAFAGDSLSKKILVLFLATTGVLILQGIYNVYSMNGVNNSIKQVHDSVAQVSRNNAELTQPLAELRQLTMNLVMAPNRNAKAEIIEKITVETKVINVTIENYRTEQNSDQKLLAVTEDIRSSWAQYKEAVLLTIKYSDDNIRIAEFMHITSDAKDAYDKLIADVTAYNNHLVDISEVIYDKAEEDSKWAFWAVILTTITEAVILKVILFYVLNLVKKRLDERKAHIQEVTEKNSELEDNISKLKTVQGKLIEAEKQASLSKLVAGVAHEINTPIGIGITSSTLIESSTSKLGERVESGQLTKNNLTDFVSSSIETTQVLIKNLHRAAEIIQRFKRLSSDNIQPLIESLNIGDKTKDTILAISPNMKGVDVNLENIQNIEVETDSGAIYHTISNLVLNAKNHAFENIESPKVVIRMGDYQEDKVTIMVQDNGNGIDEETLPKIFDPFFSTAKNNGGTGLGLSIVFNVLARINGSIRCESEKGQGTTFFIEIPGPARLVSQ